jgi:hypothetical protein
MASYDPEFYEAPKFTPEYGEPRPKQRGCFFYGCVIASVLAVLLVIGLAVSAFFFMRFVSGLFEQWTSPTPVELPKVHASEEERKAVRDRIDTFRKQLDDGTAVEPLVLTGDDLNALIEGSSDFRGTIYAKVEGDKLKAQTSIPLDKLPLGLGRGRYLNGEAELKASLSNGVLIVTLDSLEVNGKRPPEAFLQNLRQQNLAKDAFNDPKNAEMIRRFESLEIKDGKIILKPRPRDKSSTGSGEPKAPSTLPKPADAKTPPAEKPAHDAPATKAN